MTSRFLLIVIVAQPPKWPILCTHNIVKYNLIITGLNTFLHISFFFHLSKGTNVVELYCHYKLVNEF